MAQIQKNTLVDEVTGALRKMIIEGQVQPGGFLPPRKELAATFGVGLSTIQEAIQGLTALGMLASRPGKGTWVREDALDTLISPTLVENRLGKLDAMQLYEARAVVEVGLIELAAQRATAEDLHQIKTALGAMAAAEDDAAFIEADLEFHLAVARAAHNELLEQFYHLARKLLSEVIAELIKQPHVKENGLRIQQEIARAIAEHDQEKARREALRHMEIIKQLLDNWK